MRQRFVYFYLFASGWILMYFIEHSVDDAEMMSGNISSLAPPLFRYTVPSVATATANWFLFTHFTQYPDIWIFQISRLEIRAFGFAVPNFWFPRYVSAMTCYPLVSIWQISLLILFVNFILELNSTSYIEHSASAIHAIRVWLCDPHIFCQSPTILNEAHVAISIVKHIFTEFCAWIWNIFHFYWKFN